METKDFSKEIYEKYYGIKDRILQITMKDNTVLEGIFISFFHGDPDFDEPYVTRWHFIDKNELPSQRNPFSMNNDDGSFGKIINQDDIKDIKFKT